MSKDRLENFIDKHRDDFDSEIPSLNLWGEIEKQMTPKPKKNIKQIASRSAAVIALLAVACIWVFSSNNSDPVQERQTNLSPSQQFVEANPDLAEMSEYYTRKINKYKVRLAALNHQDPALLRDLRQMESAFDTLRMEWEANPHKSDEQLVNAMISNYRTRSMLLENVVERIEGHDQSFTSARPAVFREW